MLEDFWRRKEEAAANKARVSEALAGPRHHVGHVKLKKILKDLK